MESPYLITEPTVISFSGGRSSAYMLYKTLEDNDGLPDGSMIVFANTGKEMPETLDFVNDCSVNWDVHITWVELDKVEITGIYESGRHKGKEIRKQTTKIVTYESASRNGEPFSTLIDSYSSLLQANSRTCTANLKVRRIKDVSGHADCHFVGIRADEQRRVARLHNKRVEGYTAWCPMFLDGTTKQTVGDFWKLSNFDLQLPNNNGVTDFGNCDLCFLKGAKKRISIIKQRPDLVKWWIDEEEKASNQFDNYGKSYKELEHMALTSSDDMFAHDLPQFACFCGD